MEGGINQRIKEYIGYLGITVNQFSKQIGVSQSVISSMFSRNTEPSSRVLLAMINAYADMSIRWLMTGRGEKIRRIYPGETLQLPEIGEETIVCHYTKLSNLISILGSYSLFGSDFLKSNDCKEKRSISEMRFNGREYNPNLRYISFCGGPLCYKNPLLWYHYADDYKGVCLGVDVDNLGKGFIGGDIIYERNINNNKYTQEEYMMRKVPEWAGEIEYRLLFDYTEIPVLDLRNRLKYICFGSEVSEDVIRAISRLVPKEVLLKRIGVGTNGYMEKLNIIVGKNILEGSLKDETLGIGQILDVAKEIGLEEESLNVIKNDLTLHSSEKESNEISANTLPVITGETIETEEEYKTAINEGLHLLPEVSFKFAAGKADLINSVEDITRYWYLPDCKDCEGVAQVVGRSMSPTLPSGSWVALKRYTVPSGNPNVIPFGNMFGIVVEDKETGEYRGYIKILRRCKDVEHSNQYWIAHSINTEEFDDFEIEISQVRSLWIVKQHIVSDVL